MAFQLNFQQGAFWLTQSLPTPKIYILTPEQLQAFSEDRLGFPQISVSIDAAGAVSIHRREIRTTPIRLSGHYAEGHFTQTARHANVTLILLTVGLFWAFVAAAILIQGLGPAFWLLIPLVTPLIFIARGTGVLYGWVSLEEDLSMANEKTKTPQ